MPKVYNKHHGDAPEDAVYIGRPSRWGNPFSHLRSNLSILVPTREDAIEEFQAFVDKHEWYREDVKRTLRGKDLVCFCAPKACHGDILLKIANEE